MGTVGTYLFTDQFDCEKELKRLFKQNTDIPISICSGDLLDSLRLSQINLDTIAQKIGFKNSCW